MLMHPLLLLLSRMPNVIDSIDLPMTHRSARQRPIASGGQQLQSQNTRTNSLTGCGSGKWHQTDWGRAQPQGSLRAARCAQVNALAGD